MREKEPNRLAKKAAPVKSLVGDSTGLKFDRIVPSKWLTQGFHESYL